MTGTAVREAPAVRGAQKYLRAVGPGVVTGASDDDPSGIATYAQAGAALGLGLVWTALLTLPLMAAVEETCDRTAMATGKGLGELVVRRFKRRTRQVIGVLIVALLAANTLNIAADLAAIGSGMHLLHAGPSALWSFLAGVILSVLLVKGSFPVMARVFKLLCTALLSYVVVLFLVTPGWPSVFAHLLVPHVRFDSTYLSLLVAVLGTTISPYLYFWQSAHRVEQMRDGKRGRNGSVALADRPVHLASARLRTSRADVFSGMLLSNVVMFAVIVSTATTLGRHHHPHIQSAAEAATALKPLAGQFAGTLFAVGFIGTGALAVPVLAASGAIGMAGLMGRRWGFSRSVKEAPSFYGLMLAGTLLGAVLSVANVNPIQLLVVSAVVNGIAAAPFLFVIMLLANDKQIMGTVRNHWLANLLGWLTTGLMAAAAVALPLSGGL